MIMFDAPEPQVWWYGTRSHHFEWYYVDGLVEDCSNANALALELLQACTKPMMCSVKTVNYRKPNNPCKDHI